MAQKIPQTDSIQELSQFWDVHDLTDFEEQLKEVSGTVFERSTVKIHLESDEVETIRKLASLKGVSHTNLIREWILERIH